MRYKNLKFFDKSGNPIGMEYDETLERWNGSLYLSEISVSLFLNETIFILEETETTGSVVQYGFPRQDSNATSTPVSAIFKSGKVWGIYATKIDGQDIVIDKLDKLNSNFIDNTGDGYNGITERVITDANVDEVFRLNVFIMSQDGGEFEDLLTISDDFGVIAEIILYTEVIAEDERFNIHFSRLPKKVGIRENRIFRQTDLDEDLPDIKVLNEKRKLFLAETRNLIGKEGSIRGISNYLKFFGYYDIRLKEYWENSDDGRVLLKQVALYESDKLDDPLNLPKFPWYRSPDLALFYDIVRVTDNFDDDGLPITEKAFAYTQKEMLIKFFDLANYMEDNEIGGISKIVDFVGESVYFKKDKLKAWNQVSESKFVSVKIHPNFAITSDFGYIEDARAILGIFDASAISDKIVSVEDDPTFTLFDKDGTWVGYFQPTNMDVVEIFDEPNVEIGYEVELVNNSFSAPWSKMDFSWKDAGLSTPKMSWATAKSHNYYEIEWIVEWKKTDLSDIRRYKYTVRDKPEILESHKVLLPYDGFYDVTIILYGFGGLINKQFREDGIEVRTKEADFICFFDFHELDLQKWATNHLRWKDVISNWNTPIFDNQRYQIGDNRITSRSTEIVSHSNLTDLEESRVGANNLKWSDAVGVEWRDMKYKSWKLLSFIKPKPAFFRIMTVITGGVLSINDENVSVPDGYSVNEFQRFATYLNSLNSGEFSKFYYTARPIENPLFIDALARHPGNLSDAWIAGYEGIKISPVRKTPWSSFKGIKWSNMPLKWSNMDNIYYAKAIESNISHESMKVFDNQFSVPIFLPIYMVIDNSFMAGKTRIRWTLTNDQGVVVLDIYSYSLIYTFNGYGYYDIKLEIEDTNGNVKSRLYEKWIYVAKPDEYYDIYYKGDLPELPVALAFEEA